MRIVGVLPPDAPNPMDEVREKVRALPFAVMGLVPQPTLEDFGALGLATAGDTSAPWQTSVSVGYTLWRNPDDRDDPVNLAELDDDTRAAYEAEPPWPRPAWIVELAQRMRYRYLWEAVQTTWDLESTEHTTLSRHLVDHANHILMNRFHEQLGLESGPMDPFDDAGWRISSAAVNPAMTLEVDGVELPASEIDTDPFVYAIGARLAPDRVVTVVLPRDELPFVRVAVATRTAP